MQKQYTESSLKNMTKERLIELVLVNQYNFKAMQELAERQYYFLNKIMTEYNINAYKLQEFHKLRYDD